MLVSGARNQQHYYPWATAARTVPTPLTGVRTLSSLQPLAHFCIWPVEGTQAPIKLESGGATSTVSRTTRPSKASILKVA